MEEDIEGIHGDEKGKGKKEVEHDIFYPENKSFVSF